MFGGKQLEDGLSLEACGISDDSQVRGRCVVVEAGSDAGECPCKAFVQAGFTQQHEAQQLPSYAAALVARGVLVQASCAARPARRRALEPNTPSALTPAAHSLVLQMYILMRLLGGAKKRKKKTYTKPKKQKHK